MNYQNFDSRDFCMGSVRWILHQFYMNKIDATVMVIGVGLIVVQLKDHSESIQEFINWYVKPAGCLFLYDIKSTHNFSGVVYRDPSLWENIKYKAWGYFHLRNRLKKFNAR